LRDVDFCKALRYNGSIFTSKAEGETMKQKVYKSYSFPLWMVLVIKSDYKFPLPFVETSEDGHTIYIESTEKEGLMTIANLKKVRKTIPQVFPDVIGNALVDIQNFDDLSQWISKTEKLMNIKINNVAHTLRFSEKLFTYERVVIPIEKFLNNSMIVHVN
jgi:hypothetical protein